MNGSVILQERFKYSKKIIMKKYINLSILTFSLSFIISCINVKDITRVYQKGENAKEKQYYQNKENLPLLGFGNQEDEKEKVKIDKLISKTIDSLNISLDGLIIINDFIEYPNETYSFFPKNYEDFYYFNNILYAPVSFKVSKDSKSLTNKSYIINVFNYFNTSEYKEKKLDMDFCIDYSRLFLTVLKVEDNKINLFYIDPIEMCKNNNTFKTLKGNNVLQWKFKGKVVYQKCCYITTH